MASCSSSSSSSSLLNKSSRQEACSFDRTLMPKLLPKNSEHHTAKMKMPAVLDEVIKNLMEFKTLNEAKLRELQRLSLNSRQDSQRRNRFASRSSLTLEESDETSSILSIDRASNLLQDVSTTPRRQLGIVAQLMGLEDLPELNSEDSISRNTQDHHPNEAVPRTKQSKDTEERFERIHFRRQHKDLKVLKQMVEALRVKKQDQTTKDSSVGSTKVRNQPINAGIFASKSSEAPIVIMKPTRNVNVSDPSTHCIMQLEGLSTPPSLHTGSAHIPIVFIRIYAESSKSTRYQ